MQTITRLALASLIGMAAFSQPVFASSTPASGIDTTTLRNFSLDTTFLSKWKAVQTDALKDPCHLDAMFTLMKMTHDGQKYSVDQVASGYDAQPGVHAMLASHGITARDYLAGVMTLFAAGKQEMAEEHPGMVKKTGFQVSEANLAFYRQHKDEIHQFSQQTGEQMLRQNGGKMPTCPG
ncbi:MAG TPA: hypothetical protein VL997_03685 [Dyella sp.]|nr:hypothetical protein [Dyella sp.]